MIIGGLEKLTLLDYPDHLAAIIFTQGCNFRCHFCYNPMLVWPSFPGSDEKNKKEKGLSPLSTEDLFLFLSERFGKLEGVVITGGEPLKRLVIWLSLILTAQIQKCSVLFWRLN